jgi:hypothetical protein
MSEIDALLSQALRRQHLTERQHASLARTVYPILLAEPNVLRVSSPITVSSNRILT